MRPVIGISAYQQDARWGVWDSEATLVPTAYVRQVSDAGGVPIVLPPYAQAAEQLVDRIDGLLLTGGGDIDPARYGAVPDRHTQPPSGERDAAELALLDAAIHRDTPVLAICRGLQVLNVARGGTLHQHLPDVVGHDVHAATPGCYGQHPVRVEPESQLGRALGRESLVVPHYHHQGLDRLGVGLVAVAWAEDGTIEAAELTHASFVLGVQYHPEVGDDPAIFRAFTAAAAGPER